MKLPFAAKKFLTVFENYNPAGFSNPTRGVLAGAIVNN